MCPSHHGTGTAGTRGTAHAGTSNLRPQKADQRCPQHPGLMLHMLGTVLFPGVDSEPGPLLPPRPQPLLPSQSAMQFRFRLCRNRDWMERVCKRSTQKQRHRLPLPLLLGSPACPNAQTYSVTPSAQPLHPTFALPWPLSFAQMWVLQPCSHLRSGSQAPSPSQYSTGWSPGCLKPGTLH